MNKKKSLLLAILSFIAVFALAFSLGCSGCNNNDEDAGTSDDKVLSGNYEGDEDVVEDPADEWVLQSIALDVSELKTTYNYGEDFEASKKPVVKATFATLESVIKNEEGKLQETTSNRLVTEERTVSADDVKIDFGQYDKNAVGTYNIYVSYSHAGVTRSAKYAVEVVGTSPEIGGITVVAENDFVTEYTIRNTDGITIEGLEKLHVYTVNSSLEVSEEEVDSADYTVEYYHNGTKVESIEAITKKGDYTIMFKYNNASAFVVVSVLDPLVSITFLQDAEGTKTTQVQSTTDEMTPTWQFEVLYTSTTKIIYKKGDAGLSIPRLATVLSVANGTATVVYAEEDESVSTTVSYVIEKDEDLNEKVYTMSYAQIPVQDDQTVIPATSMTGVNAFITPLSKLRYRTSSYLDFNGDALSVTALGFGTLQIAVRSTGSSNISGFYLEDEEGNYIPGIFDAGVGITAVATENGTAQIIADPVTTFRTVTFVLPEAGTYKLGSLAVGTAGVTQAYTRVNSIVLTDVFDKNIDVVDYYFTINTESVLKDYIAGKYSEVQTEGLTAVYTADHSVEQDVVVNLTAENLTVEVDGDLITIGAKRTVKVSYTAGGTTYSATYNINITSPVVVGTTDVNSVAGKALTVDLEKDQTTATVNVSDIKFFANSTTGEEITLDADNTATFNIFDGDENEITASEGVYTLAEGTYTVKSAIVSLVNNKEGASTGKTTFAVKDFTITVKAYVEAGATIKKTVHYAVDTSTEIYTMTSSDDTDNFVTITHFDGSTSNQGAWSQTVDGVKYSDYIEVNGTTRYIKVEIPNSIKSAKITVIGGSSNAGRTVALFKGVVSSAADSKAANALDSFTSSSDVKAGSFTVDITEGGTYTVTAVTGDDNKSVTLRVLGIIVEYEVSTEQSAPTKIELDASSLTVQDAITANSTVAWGECAEIVGYGAEADKKVAIVADNATLVGDKAGTTVSNRIKLGGGIQSNGAQGIKLTLDKACTVKVYIKNSGTGTGRIPNLFNASKSAVTNSTVELDTTGSIHEITLNVTDEMITANNGVLYLGVNTGGCLVYYVTIDYGA